MDVKVILLVVGLLTLLKKPAEADYIWHYDEIPYEARASCKRSTSYYSNSITANNTDIDVASDIDSLLDYSNKDICFYCVCSVDGKRAGCISRDPWFCEYYRVIRNPDAPKNRYQKLFQQDRPPYFRQLSYRLRRTMDDGIVTFYDAVGVDTLNSSKCVPFVSEYSDCTEANYCSGCNRCRCTAEAEWQCERVFECPIDDNDDSSDQNTLTSALDVMYTGLKDREKKKTRALVPPPPSPEDDLIVSDNNPYDVDFETYLSRQKRELKEKNSTDKNDRNRTVKFFHTVDEINSDTLKNSNNSGTIEARKMEANKVPKLSRRTGLFDNFNKSSLSSLHIEYNQPQDYDHHISENKIDAASQSKVDEYEFRKLIGNYSQNIKDKDLSKLVVNELKVGSEIVGDKNVSPTSNITFTPENDTLTAMAFIAGNLLSKLWDMEKDSSDDSIETEVLKHEKINDLLDLFKEPLSIRQETFLKNALEKLSDTLNKNKSLKNVSICETITDPHIRQSSNEQHSKDDLKGQVFNKTKCSTTSELKKLVKEVDRQRNITSNVISKLNNVVGLIKRFENVQNNLKILKHESSYEFIKEGFDTGENLSFQFFGTLLDKITKLLIPKKTKSRILTNKLKNSYQFSKKKNITNIIGKKFNIIFDNIDLTTKDRLILDYLNHIESNPTCLLNTNNNKQATYLNNNADGSILNKLSEFLKVKSYIDLITLTKSEVTNSTIQHAKFSTESYKDTSTSSNILRKGTNEQLNNTKENLKSHLKAIINDLLQLQQDQGVNNVKKVNIIDVLPCIYNILNSDTTLNRYKSKRSNITQNLHLDKMKAIIDTLKNEIVTNVPTRRHNYISQDRPKSAKIWERMIKNINRPQKKTRRSFLLEKPKSYEQLRNIMEHIESIGNTYKNFALLAVVPPQKRLMLLKTLEADAKQQSIALTHISSSMDTIDNLASDKRKEIKEFVENVENNLQLSSKVLNNLEKSKTNSNKKSKIEILITKANKIINKSTPISLKLSKVENRNNNFKLNRNQILNQLMMNRVQAYLKSKEDKGVDISSDINYNIGKRILLFIRRGNSNVARELFKIFIANKQKEQNQTELQDSTTAANYLRKRGPMLLALREPLITIDGPAKDTEMGTDDRLFSSY